LGVPEVLTDRAGAAGGCRIKVDHLWVVIADDPELVEVGEADESGGDIVLVEGGRKSDRGPGSCARCQLPALKPASRYKC
jgi:hypothetical protein